MHDNEAAFLALRERFCAGLPARWAQISSARDREALTQALHQLAGAAGSFGLQELAEVTRTALDASESDMSDAELTELVKRVDIALHAACTRPDGTVS